MPATAGVPAVVEVEAPEVAPELAPEPAPEVCEGPAEAFPVLRPGQQITTVCRAFIEECERNGYTVGGVPMTYGDLIGPRGPHALSHPRLVCVWLIRHMCEGVSFPMIGRHFGGRDHTTILSAARRGRAIIDRRADLRQIAASVAARFGFTLPGGR